MFSRGRQAVHPEKPRNVHLSLLGKISAEGEEVNCISGDYIYFHYCHDGFNDAGWGCAYRSLQTLYSWFLLQGYASSPVPTIPEIQRILVKMGDKPEKFIGRLASPRLI